MVKSGVSILTLFCPATPKMLVSPEPSSAEATLRMGAGWTDTTGVGLKETDVCFPDEIAALTAPLI